MKKLLIILLIPLLTQACLWLEGTTIDGSHKQFADEIVSSMFLKISQETTAQKNFEDKFHREENQTEEYLALQNIMNGQYDQGVERLLKIEQKHQNLYSTASNLGTAYELKGDIPLAIQWIAEGIKRDANSHYGTEWLHLLILETKLELKNNPTLLKNNHIINLPKKFNETTLISIKGKNYSLKSIRNALFYQLKERLIFVKPKDEVVADLLYTFAKIEEQTTVVEEADKLLMMAKEYGFDNQKEIDAIYKSINKSISNLRQKAAFLSFLTFLGFILLVIIVVKLIKKGQKEKLQTKEISPLSFALSINVYLLLFTILSLPIYAFLQKGTANMLLFYLLLIPSYLLAIYFGIKDIQKRYTIDDAKKSIGTTVVIYIGVILFIYFQFLRGGQSEITIYFMTHMLLAVGIFYFLKWRISHINKKQGENP